MPATAIEQMILELINRARLDPAAEAARDGIDLNEGLPAGTISTASKQPLAMNDTLLTIARAHDQDMLAHNYFAHTDSSGHDPFQRMTAAGYNYNAAGENIAWNGTTGSLTTQMSVDMEEQLFVDAGVAGRGHRTNLLDGSFQEVGAGIEDGSFQGYNATLLTQDFGTTGAGQFLTGVSYNDLDHNNFYSIGEGRGGVSVAVSGGGSTTTASAGGYTLAIGAGQQTVTFSGGGLASPVNVAVTVLSGTNAKVDMVDQGVIDTSASLTDLGGATRIIGLGTTGLTLTGDAGSETFSGTKGDDVISGGGGVDSVIFTAARSAYTIANIGNDSLRVSGPDGTDTLNRIDRLIFTDQTVNLTQTPNDFNGDGTSDILWRDSTSGATETWLTKGAGGFSYANDGAPTSDWQVSGTGDFNGDGKADILWSDANGDRSLWNSNGAGGFSYQDLGGIATSWSVSGVGDFNGDGKADILWSNANGDRYLWNSSESGGFSYQDLGTISTDWSVSGVGDFNGDGKADVLWSNSNGDRYLWASNGSGGFSYQDLGTISTDWSVSGIGDFNGDGKADILWSNANGDRFLWDSNTSGGFNYQDLGTIPTGWSVSEVGDFNGDGKADVLWSNASGDRYLWSSNASGGFSYQNLGVVGTNWQVQA